MIGSTRILRVFAYCAPADLRKGYNGLHGLVSGEMGMDVLSGDCFLFINRRRTQAKVLLWDGSGLCIYQKRLEEGRFAPVWERAHGENVALSMSELHLLLDGSDLVGRRRLLPDPVCITPLNHAASSMKMTG